MAELPRQRWRVLLFAAAAATLAAGCLALSLASRADAIVEVHDFSVTRSTAQAGGHPDVTISFRSDFDQSPQTGDPCQCNDPKDIRIEFPTGFIGDPHATPRCSAADFLRQACPPETQVGRLYGTVWIGGETPLQVELQVLNLKPKPNQAGLLASRIPIFDAPIYTILSARTGSDYGLNALIAGIQQFILLGEIKEELWGVPADESHTPYREGIPNGGSPFFQVSQAPLNPFLSNPTTCSGPVTSAVEALGYDDETFETSSDWSPTTGCDQLTFNPSLSAQPTTTETDSPSGLEVDLRVPQEESPSTPSPSELRAASVTLPEGFSINSNAADGKTSCPDAAARYGTTEAAECPEYAKIGTDTLESSALPGPIDGAVYLGEPLPGDRYRLILTADGFATHVKLAGSIRPDPSTGRLTVVFQDLPQSPLTDFNLHFFGSERGSLATPTKCGTYAVESSFTPWDEALGAQTATQLFRLDSGPGGSPCPGATRPFEPSFSASAQRNSAGRFSPFSIELAREDGDQDLTGLTARTPPGLSASLRGIPYCPAAAIHTLETANYSGLAEAASPACPAASRVGTAQVGVGAGTHPLYVAGRVYLAGPYRGAPLSLVVSVPAVSGPYDLGTVAVRVALDVDPLTAQVTAVSDSLPQIVAGIPLRIRSILVSLDREGFTLNPTDCEPFSVDADVQGSEAASVTRSKRFQVANCARLPFAPKLSLRLTGGLNRLGHPAIHALLRAAPGEANLQSTTVILPKGELLDQTHIGAVCTKVDFARHACPAGSLIGHAEVTTPLLDQPLTGSVYLRSSSHGLPDIALDLQGQFQIEAVGRVDSVNERYRASFPAIPDVPVSRIALNLLGGHRGLLQNSEGLCPASRRATVAMVGQNGGRLREKVSLGAACR